MNGVTIQVVNGGLGQVAPSIDGVSGLIVGGLAILGGAQFNTVYQFFSLADAESLLITSDYDQSNAVLVHHQISEFFRMSPNGELWFVMVPLETEYEDIFALGDPTSAANRIKSASEGRVNQLAACYVSEDPVITTTVLIAGIAHAQAFATACSAANMPLVVILEGKGTLTGNNQNLHVLNAPQVAVMIGQNAAPMEEDSVNATYGAVGTLLGALSFGAVNENVGWVRKFNLQGGSLQSIGVLGYPESSTSFTPTLQQQLHNFGYVFFTRHTGIAGIYFNDTFTCTALADDLCNLENNRVINKAKRLIRTALLPDLLSPINVNPTTGRLAPDVVKKLEVQGKRAIDEGMLNLGQISGFQFIIDENQNILSTSELVCELSITPTGTARQIKIKIGFSNPF